MSYILAIDYGTSFTAAAIATDGGRAQRLEIGGRAAIPSAVFLDESGRFLVGEEAQNSAGLAPDRFERWPKRHLGEQTLLLGGGSRAPEDAVAAVLWVALEEARRRYDGEPPRELRLTHPARWAGEKRLDALSRAGEMIGFPSPRLMSEPEAAARYFADEGLAAGSFVAVYDLGGGTFDTAVLTRREDGRFTLAGVPTGDERMGGEHFDKRLFDHLAEAVRTENPEAWSTLQTSTERRHIQARTTLITDVREAKERLSTMPHTDVWVGDPVNTDVRIQREEFQALIATQVKKSVGILATTISNAGLEPDELEALYLTGGSSRIPLVKRQVEAALGLTHTKDDPKTIVSQGAASPDARPRGMTTKPLEPDPPPPPPPAPPPPEEPKQPMGDGGGPKKESTDVPVWKRVPAMIAAVLVAMLVAGFGVAAATGAFTSDEGGGDTSTPPPDPPADPGPVPPTDPEPDPPTDPEPTSDPDAEAELFDYLPVDLFGASSDCSSYDPADAEVEALAGYDCYAPGIDVLRYYIFEDQGSMDAFFDQGATPPITEQEFCDNSWELESTWFYGSDDTPAGRIKCYDNDEGVWMEWTEESLLVSAYASSETDDRKALYDFWSNVASAYE